MAPVASAQSITIGVTGQYARGSVSPWGDVRLQAEAGGDPTLRWFVAADDRWHVPGDEVAVRQNRIDGTPVLETRLRIPDGDAVQRIWSVADCGGATIIEVENDSPLPFAVAFSGLDLVTERPPADIPIKGIDLPDGAIIMPVGHHATVRAVLPHRGAMVHPSQVSALPSAQAVVRGWLTVVHRASRLDLPEESLVGALTAARCDLLLDGPVGIDDDPAGFLFDIAELGRLGDDSERWMSEVADPIASISRSNEPEIEAVLRSCERLALAAGDERAAGDIARLRVRRVTDGLSGVAGETRSTSFSDVRRGQSVGRFVASIERLVCDGGEILRSGIPKSWLGMNFEVHGVPAGPRSTLSYAVRWHGERPAVLWEQKGEACRLSAPAIDPEWTSQEIVGETLWAAPSKPTKIGLIADLGNPPAESASFG
ncbi:MAG: hypothetical protein DRJ50_12045 [Actinobacteria bacterium]|nr:MAG: hypothetical protein DRJ50_12045 [Actinomycetota bacterium]